MKRLVLAALLVASSAGAQPTQATVDSLRAELAQIKVWKAALDSELGPVVDPGALAIRARIRQLGVAFNGVVARMEGIPGDTRIVDVLREQYSPILTRLPPANRTVVEYVNSAIAAAGTGTGTGAQGPPGPPGPRGPTGLAAAAPVIGFGSGIDMQEGEMESMLWTSDFDNALRLAYNNSFPNATTGSTHRIPSLVQMYQFFEKDGVVSFTLFKADTEPSGPYDTGGKSLAFKLGTGTARTPNVGIYSGNPGRGLEIGVARRAPNIVENGLYDMTFSATDAVNPIGIVLGGVKRKLVPCTISGVNAVCWQ